MVENNKERKLFAMWEDYTQFPPKSTQCLPQCLFDKPPDEG